jgi:flagellar capping protein FliD
MDLLGTSINAVMVAVVGAVLAWFAKGQFEALGYRIDRLETRLDGRIDTLETRLDGRIDGLEGRFDTLQSSLDGLRSDLTQVALAVGVHPRAQND